MNQDRKYDVVALISSDTEWKIMRAMFPQAAFEKSPFGEQFEICVASRDVLLFHGGWGKVSAAATTQYCIDRYRPALLVNLATCGGFSGLATVGEVVCVNECVIYDIVEQMSDPQEAIDFYTTKIDLSWLRPEWLSGIKMARIASADKDLIIEEIPQLIEKYQVRVGDWESGPIAWVAQRNNQRVLVLRGVTDLVGAQGGEVYDNMPEYTQRTKLVMAKVMQVFAGFLTEAGPVLF